MRDRSVSSSKPRSNFSSLNVKTRYRRVHSSIGASIVDPSKTAFFLNTEVASMHIWQSYSLAWAKPNSAPKTDRKRVVKGKSVSVRVDLGGRGTIKKKKANTLSDTCS